MYKQCIIRHVYFISCSNLFLSLVEEKADEEDIQELLRFPQGILHEACCQGTIAAVKMLLERGVATSEWDRVSSKGYIE